MLDIPGHRIRLYQNPVSQIRQILVLGSNLYSSGKSNVVITDAQTISEIMTALRSAKPYSPNHPSIKRHYILVIADVEGESYVDVAELSGEGFILYCETANGGFIFDRLRSYSIGSVLERAVMQK